MEVRVREVILKNCGTCVLIPFVPQVSVDWAAGSGVLMKPDWKLSQLPALQVRMEEEDGVEEEEEVEEEVDHADEGTFDLDFGPLLGEILQVD